jgi:hypothetical protein
MLPENLQSCPQLLAAFGLGALVSAGVAFAVIQSRAPNLATSPAGSGRFTLTSPAASTFVRFDSATGEIVVYIAAGPTPGAYRLSDLPVTGRDPASSPSSTAGKPHP